MESNENYDLQSKSNGQEKMFEELNEEHKSKSAPFLAQKDPLRPNFSASANFASNNDQDFQLKSPDVLMDPDEGDVIDFLFSQESELGLAGVLPNIEDILLNLDEFPFVYPRLAKLFNFIASHLEAYMNQNDPTESQNAVEGLTPYIRLLLDTYDISRFTQLLFFCVKHPCKLRLSMSPSFLQDFLYMASKNLHEIAGMYPTLLQFLEFAIAPSDVFGLSIPRPYLVVFAHFLQNIYEKPTKELFRFLSQVFFFLPHSLIPRFCEDLLLPTFVILESGLEETAKSLSKEEKQGIMEIIDDWENEQEEMFVQIAKLLTLIQISPKAKETLFVEKTLQRLYNLLRGAHNLGVGNKKLKISLKCTLMIIQTIVCQLQGAEKRIKEEFTQEMYKDIIQSLEKPGSKFLSNVIFPLLSAPALNVIPVCLHLDEEPEALLNSLKSNKNNSMTSSKVFQPAPLNPYTLSSALLNSQEKNTILSTIQKLCFSNTKKKNSGTATGVHSLQWKRCLQIDFDNAFGGNPLDITQSLTKTDGVLMVFHCLLGQEIAKIGLYCNTKLTQNNLADAYSNQYGGLRAYQSPENFFFYYSDIEKLHFPTSKVPNDTGVNLKASSKEKPSSHSKKNKPSSLSDIDAVFPNDEYLDEIYSMMEEENNMGKKYSKAKSKPKASQVIQPKIPCVEYSGQRIALYYEGKPILEYFPSAPDTSKVEFRVSNMISLEEYSGKTVLTQSLDSHSVAFVQGVEIWTASFPEEGQKQQDYSQDFMIQELANTTKSAFYDIFKTIRTESPVYLIQKGTTFGDFFTMLFKGNTNLLSKLQIRNVLAGNLALTMKVEELLYMYEKSDFPQILDIFVNTTTSAQVLANELASPEEICGNLLKSQNTEEDLVKYIMTKERAKTLLGKAIASMDKGNNAISKGFKDLLEEMQIFWSMQVYEDMLAEDQEFFGLVLNMLGSTKNKQVLLKLNQRAYAMLEKVFNTKDLAFIIDLDLEKFISTLLKKLKSLDKEADKDGIAVIQGEVNMNSKPGKSAGKKPFILNAIKNKLPFTNNLFGAEESKANDDLVLGKEEDVNLSDGIVNQLQNSVITSLMRIMEIELPDEVYEKNFKQIKEEKLMTTILRFLKINSLLGPQNDDNGKLQTDILTLLELWSRNDYLSELFWEELEGYELIGQEQQKIPIYQRFMEIIEQSKEKSDGKDFKRGKPKSKKAVAFSTHNLEAIESNLHKIYDINIIEKTTDISNDLALPLAQSYPKCLKHYCVDSANILNHPESRAHHYKNSFSSSSNPSSAKVTRITKELSDLANSLPVSATNAILVRYDQTRMDAMKVLIFGSAETPYGHGAFEYDIFIGDDYPNQPPQVNLMTTGNGTIRFNPNLYACGKVCLSLLGTWRGNGNENWKPNMSTILQVLISIQSIIMTEDVYYNEPGFEGSKGSAEGKRLNEGYSNIVKYANVKFAMVETLKNPPAAFKEPVLIHFYLKKYMIMEELNKWLAEAKHTDGLYTGLVTSHNNNLAHKFQSKDAYYNSLKEAIHELEELLDNLNLRLEKTFKIRTVEWKRKKPRKEARKIEPEAQITFADIKQIDVEYDEKVQHKLIDLKDEKVTNRWSRYIGAMGLEAVEKQANSCVFLIGLNAVGVEIAKNIVLSGVKKFCVCDWKKVEATDLAGQFFLSEKDIGKNRAEASLNKLQALNQYVQLNIMKEKLSSDNVTKQLGKLDSYNVLVCCEGDLNLQICLNEYCRAKGILFISATVKGLFSRVFCDFGDNFQVIDKTGEEQQEFVVRAVTPEGVVHLLEGVKHGLQDNDKIIFVQAEEDGEGKSFTETTHSVLVKDKNSFSVGDISGYRQLKSGIIKPLKKQETLSFKPFSDTLETPPLDYSISGVDFLAQHKYQLLHVLFLAIEKYVAAALTESKTIDSIFKRPVEVEVTDTILRDTLEELKRTAPETVEALRDEKEFSGCLTWVNGLVDTYNGVFPPLCAFIGGVVSQEIIKGITRKYTPIKQYFYYECAELYESNRKPSELLHDSNIIDKYEPLKICVGEELFEKLRDTKLFMVGAGAIGCELLKNYAMLGLASNKGKIVLTDPDVIESSNLNRQFLFREKHIRKPKAATAAAVAVQMNPDLHEKVLPMLEKVHEASENIFTEKFFEELDVVTNALDNIQARKYVDSRCIKSRTPLLESGTLGPKGHVQVIIPFKTESYGSQQDPQEDNEIPYCTLKMFPEETLHCIEWARDKFTKMYSQKPSSFVKAMESFSGGKVETLDEKILKEAVKFGKSFPKKFEDCVQWALNKYYKLFVHDIKQLLYTYPLDFKTADGQLFWSLPKRPPHPAPFDPNNASHVAFMAACACLRARVCGIEPPKNARIDKVKKEIAATAAKLKPKAYKISDEKAKELKKQNDKEEKNEKNEKMIVESQEEEKTEKMELENFGKQEMTVELITLFKNGKSKANKYLCNPQEFEKDEDENFHIDFLHAMTNCRAENYGLTNMDWLNVKLKAGRIVPALATTTAAIAGLQTIELCKLLAKCRIEQHKNSFLNFSIPILAQSEPMNAPEFQLSSNLKVNMWDRWEIDLNKKNHIKTIKDLFKELEKTTGLQPLDLLQGNTPVYLYQLMEMPSKSKEKEIILNKNLEDFMQYHGQKHVDVTITFTSEEAKLKNPKDITIKGIPPIRIYYNV